jgi:hypothetical protein
MEPTQPSFFDYKERQDSQNTLRNLFEDLGVKIQTTINEYEIKSYDNSSHDGKFIPKDWPTENTIILAKAEPNTERKWEGFIFSKDPENNEVISMIGNRVYAPEVTLFNYLNLCCIDFDANQYQSEPGKERVYIIPVEDKKTQTTKNIVILQKEDGENSETIVLNWLRDKVLHFQSSVINLPDFIIKNKDIKTINSYNSEIFKRPNQSASKTQESEENNPYDYVKDGRYELPDGTII